MLPIAIRPATPADTILLAELICSLAEYERLSDVCTITPEVLETHLFSKRPVAEAVIAELDGEAQGFALFFTTFSTFVGKPSLYLEDLFVKPDARGKGIGKSLLLHLVRLAKDRGYGRVEWAVLDWNEPAIQFYKKLGARPMEDWKIFRLDETAMANLP